MSNFSRNGSDAQFPDYETPFADTSLLREEPSEKDETPAVYNFVREAPSPFQQTFEMNGAGGSPFANEFVNLVGELNDTEFTDAVYELAADLEDTWNPKVANEATMGQNYMPFVNRKAEDYFRPLISASENMIDRAAQHFSSANGTEAEVDRFFNETDFSNGELSPVQDQFFGKLVNKVKSAVKKGISVVGKLNPVNILLNKLKKLIRPLLERVLKFALGKLPKNLQPYAQQLAAKFLNLPVVQKVAPKQEPATDVLDAVQSELDNNIANLVFAQAEQDADYFVMEYASAAEANDHLDNESGYTPSLDVARQQFIAELNNLKEGESPAPAIERFLPVALMALRPIVKPAIAMIGRPKIINFLAGLLAKLVGKYVPEKIARPLAGSIIDVGMKVIGFETNEDNSALAHETLVDTIEETVQLMELDEVTDDEETLTQDLLTAFETAVTNHFPSQYIREELRSTKDNAVWVLMPRSGGKHLYKKYTKVFDAVIDPQAAMSITTYRGLPLANFLKDKLGLDPTKNIQARVHLFKALKDTKLSSIHKHENIPGFNAAQPHAWVQLHPLSKVAAAMLLKEPSLGRDLPKEYTTKRSHIKAGQQFYYLEIAGARLRFFQKNGYPGSGGKPVHSADIRGTINFIKSEIKLHYYFSEEESKSIVEKLNGTDGADVATIIRYAVKNVMREILLQNITTKVKIIHESFPELFLENYDEETTGQMPGPGKQLLTSLVNTLCDRLSGIAYASMLNYFKTGAADFKNAQSQPADGVTVKLTWSNIAGMSALKSLVGAIKGNMPLGKIKDVGIPAFPNADIQVVAGKQFEI